MKGARKKGFTLIELLVVIAIIAILAAILFPVYARVKENARGNTCRSNMKQLTSALIAYREDNGNYMPQALFFTPTGATVGVKKIYWPNALMGVKELRSKVFKCPSDDGSGGLSYAINGYLIGFFACGWGNILFHESNPVSNPSQNNVDLPTKVITLAEWENQSIADPERPSDISSRREGWFTYAPPARTADYRHLGKGNYGFWDGHVETLRPSQVGRDSQGAGGSTVLQSPKMTDGRPQAGCGTASPGTADVEPWWGPGYVAAAAKAGAGFAINTAGACGNTAVGQNVWDQYGHPTSCWVSRSGRASYEHPVEWYYGMGDDLGPGVDGHWYICLVNAADKFGRYPYGTMATFNPGL